MKFLKHCIVLAMALASVSCLGAGAPPALPLEQLTLPDGFEITAYGYAEEARQMAIGERGTLFVGSRRAGNVYALQDRDGNGSAETTMVIARDLKLPSGLAYRDGSLFVGAVDQILRYDNIEARLLDPPAPVIVTDRLPNKTHHGWKYLNFSPDGALFVPVGAPCNICLSSDPRFASILRMDVRDGSTTVFASGIRNTVGFTWHPADQSLWFTDNGRDMLGDEIPPEELNRAPNAGLHFGYPFVHGDDIADPEFGAQTPESIAVTRPALKIQAHAAALGIEFYTGTQFPERYRGALFIAEHGSWNRTPAAGPVGYRVSVAFVDGDRITGYEPFIEGWLQGKAPWGRPNDVLMLPDGSLLISDDGAGVIYRVTYRGAAAQGDTTGGM